MFQIQGRDPLIDVAVELEKLARSDDYFVKRNLYPNVDFYSGAPPLALQVIDMERTEFRRTEDRVFVKCNLYPSVSLYSAAMPMARKNHFSQLARLLSKDQCQAKLVLQG